MTCGHLCQAAILITSGGAIALAVNWELPTLASLVGLIGQPFWLVESWRARQWGVFALSAVYTLMFAAKLWGWAIH